MVQQPEVEWPTCEQAGCIGIRLASARACLAHASQEETANALKLVGDTGAIDVRGVLITDALLKRILTAAPLGENEEPLIKSCRFDRTTFTGDAEFDGATSEKPLSAARPPGGRPSTATPSSMAQSSSATPDSTA